MKMTQLDFDILKSKIDETLKQYPKLKEEYKQIGLSNMRFNWDLARLAKIDICAYYSYLDDTHINTALAKAVGNSGK
jgi:hypothetical protein